jgi:hypothetical protein
MLGKLSAVVAICAAELVLNASAAAAQCAPGTLLKNHAVPVFARSSTVRTDPAHDIWKTVTLGAFANSFALRNALDAADCGIGDLAEEILARPAFTLASNKTAVDLVVVSAAELGLTADSASLKDIYSRAEKLGLSLAPAEVGPELRLQYFDQPTGEFLHVGMNPIKTWKGDPVIFVVANGGAGLILIGENGSAETQVSTSSSFLFVRPREIPREQRATRQQAIENQHR